MMIYQDKVNEISQVLFTYFVGIHKGDIEILKECFTSDVHIYGDVNNEEYKKSISEYLEGVANRKSPNDLEETFRMKILCIEVINNVAIAKLHVPMLGFNYYDFLSLSCINGEWKIVNKIFTHVN